MAALNLQPLLTATPAPLANRQTTPPAKANAQTNSASSAESSKRASESKKPEASQDATGTFASTLKSQMNKKPAESGEASKSRETGTARTQAADAAPDDDGAISSSDLAALLPLLVSNLPVADATVLDPELAAGAKLSAAAPELPSAEDLIAMVQSNAPAVVIQLAPTLQADTKLPRPGSAKDPAEPGLFDIVPDIKPDAIAATSEKIAVDTAIAADPRKARNSDATEPRGDDFRAFMERAATVAQTAGNRASAPAATSLRVDTPMGQAGWHEDMGQKLTWMAGNNRQHAELVLTPPQLGRIEVSLTINGDQASAVFTSANPAVREALEESMQRLREILADAGVSLGQTQVGAESPNQFARNEDNGNRSPGGRGNGERYGVNLELPVAASNLRTSSGLGMVDIFA